MIKTIFSALIVLLLIGCTRANHEFMIQGTLPSAQYDGESIYLVPVKNPTDDTVDSAKIVNASFTFRGNYERISMLTTRPILRIILQPLLVVTEPGIIKVRIDSTSSLEGTNQNVALQSWKEEKEKMNTAQSFIRKSLRNANSADSMNLIQLRESLKKQERAFNYSFLRKQGKNTVGSFVYELVRSDFTKKQQRELDSIQK